jgi:uncharacterized protein
VPSTPFLNLFGRSPIRPLEAHMGKVAVCVATLQPFFEAALAGEWKEAKTLQEKIVLLENEADSLKRDLRLHLPKGLFLPVERGDLLSLLTVQDRLANRAKDIAGTVLGRQMVFPKKLIRPFQEFLSHCLKASELANKAIHELDELLETSFSGAELKLVAGMVSELSEVERQTDHQQTALCHALFAIEDTLPPIHVMFLYRILDWTGEIADCAQETGNRLQILLAR